MTTQPTLILTVCDSNAPMASCVDVQGLGAALQRLQSLNWPILLVCNAAEGMSMAQVLPRDDILTVAPRSARAADQQVQALVEGLQARAQSAGWLLLPCAQCLPAEATIAAVAQALQRYPLAYAEYRQQRGMPMAFGAELYSEIIQLGNMRDLERLQARYPACAVDVDDPAAVLSSSALHSGAMRQGGAWAQRSN